MSKTSLCPCGAQKKYSDCCEQIISGKTQAETAEQLMRSRYCAFIEKNMAYVQATTDPQTRFDYDIEANKKWAEDSEFEGLEILKTAVEGNKATVEFKATFRSISEAKTHVHHEISKFRKQGGVWYFRDGKVLSEV